MKMRDLERQTGIHRETIRVYLRKGLLPQPHRPKPNVAEYGDAHVRGILAIRHLQQERRLPLAQIKRALDGDTSAMAADAAAFPQLNALVAARLGMDEGLVPLTSVMARNALAESDARAFERVGAVRLKRRDRNLYLSHADAQLVALWGDMRSAGFTEERGFGPEIAQMYVRAAASLARAEVKEFLSKVSRRLDADAAADMARTALSRMLAFFDVLRMKAALEELERQTAPARHAPAVRRRPDNGNRRTSE